MLELGTRRLALLSSSSSCVDYFRLFLDPPSPSATSQFRLDTTRSMAPVLKNDSNAAGPFPEFGEGRLSSIIRTSSLRHTAAKTPKDE